MTTRFIQSTVTLVGFAMLLGCGCASIADPQANAVFREALGHTTITIFPTYVRDEEPYYHAESAQAIGDFFVEQNVADVTLSHAEVPITSEWGMNQAKMLKDSAADFTRHLQGNPIETEYGLLAEYLIGGRGVPVGVHAYIMTAAGTCADVALLNSHWEAFTAVDPQTVDDCTTVLLNALREELAPTE
ncbi:MAG: hypothetical protein JSU63_01375 [Phycisphaerales bacterium]|nr:MAG: hypothetical protein JSU63_01375 [Phycisphaerales bacterium]